MMKRSITRIGVAALLLVQAAAIPVHAAAFPTIQPYVMDNEKIGFTNGEKVVTPPIYDSIEQYPRYVIVTAAGKKGILDAKSGKTIAPATWDSVEIKIDGNIAIVQKGGWFQYLDLATQQLSQKKFVGAHTYYLSDAYPDVVVMGGEQTMMLAPSGKVLLPLFAGKISFVDLYEEADDAGEEKRMRYAIASTADQLTLYDPVTMQPKFSLNKAEYLPQDGAKSAYIRVRVAGKEGLVDSNGNYVLEPKYKKLTFWNHGYVRVESETGIGLWRNGKMLAEPRFADVGIESVTKEVYSTKDGQTVTYHTADKAWSYSFKPGAEIVHADHILGQDLKTGLYGVVKIGGEVVIPFQYPRVEGPPAARLLVRQDGKKGLLPGYELPMQEPQFWFDTLTTIGGSYSMLSIQDGKKIGLYSERKGLLLPPQENRVIHYEQQGGKVKVSEPDGTTLYYGVEGIVDDPGMEFRQDLTEHLRKSATPDKKIVLIDRKADQQIGKAYSRALYYDNATDLVVGMDAGKDEADLYTAEGKLITNEIKVRVQEDSQEGMPVVLAKMNNAVYTIGKTASQSGWALVKVEGDQITALTPFVYRNIEVQMMKDNRILVLTRADGKHDLWVETKEQGMNKLEGAVSIQTFPYLDGVLVESEGGWDAYSSSLQRKTNGNYGSMQMIENYGEKNRAILLQDQKTGLYGLLSIELSPMTPLVYESIRATDHVFLQVRSEEVASPPFVFTTKQHFGYLDGQGKELFKTNRVTK